MPNINPIFMINIVNIWLEEVGRWKLMWAMVAVNRIEYVYLPKYRF